MIAEYEAGGNPLLDGPRQYGLTQQHKHLKEMKKISNLAQDPIFCPIVSNFYRGMEVTVPVFAKDIRGGINELKDYYRTYYSGQFVKLNEEGNERQPLPYEKIRLDDLVQELGAGAEQYLTPKRQFGYLFFGRGENKEGYQEKYWNPDTNNGL